MNLGEIMGQLDALGVSKPPVTNFIIEKYIGVRCNERFYNERMLQRTFFINKISMIQRTQMLQ